MVATMPDVVRRLVMLQEDVRDILTASRSVADRAALKTVQTGLQIALDGTAPEAIPCPICGERPQSVRCRWCGAMACTLCAPDMHARATDDLNEPDRPCPSAPREDPKGWRGPEEPDTNF